LAHPVVRIVLGQKWLDVVPVLQILAFSLMLNFPVGLEYPTLVAVGAIRFLPAIVLAQAAVFTGLWWLGAASYGLYGGAASMLVIVPVNLVISLCVVRSLVPLSCGELAGAMRKSAVSLGLSAAGPAITVILSGWSLDLSIRAAFVAVILSGIGWIYGLQRTRHPLAEDVFRAWDSLLRHPAAVRVMTAGARLLDHWRHRGPERR
jgi:O-antigen/teichoic acid export membrane protein